MKPSIIFLNGPEDDRKRKLVRILRKKFNENACVALNRKDLLSMLNANDEDQEESFEWIVTKIVKNIVNNGVFIVFDAFLPSRRMQQYVQQMSGLPCYWIGVFFSEHDQQFYDYTVTIAADEVTDATEPVFVKMANIDGVSQAYDSDIETAADSIFEFVANNEPRCFEAFKEVEFPARRRMIANTDHAPRAKRKVRLEFETSQDKREYKERKFKSLKGKYSKDEGEKEEKPGFLKSLFKRRKDGDRKTGDRRRPSNRDDRGNREERTPFKKRFDAWKLDPNLDKKREAFNEFAKGYKSGDEFFKHDFEPFNPHVSDADGSNRPRRAGIRGGAGSATRSKGPRDGAKRDGFVRGGFKKAGGPRSRDQSGDRFEKRSFEKRSGQYGAKSDDRKPFKRTFKKDFDAGDEKRAEKRSFERADRPAREERAGRKFGARKPAGALGSRSTSGPRSRAGAPKTSRAPRAAGASRSPRASGEGRVGARAPRSSKPAGAKPSRK